MRPRRTDLAVLGCLQLIGLAALSGWMFVLRLPLGKAGEWAYRVNDAHWPVVLGLPYAFLTVATVAMLAALATVLPRLARGRRCVAMAVLYLAFFGGTLSMQRALLAIYPEWVPNLIAYQMSDVSTGYLAESYRIADLSSYLREYPRTAVERGQHLQTRPPGAVVAYYGLRRLVERHPASADVVEDWLLPQADAALRYARQFPGAADLPRQAVQVALLAALATMLAAAGAATVVLALRLRGAMDSLSVAMSVAGAGLVGAAPALMLFSQCLDMVLVLIASVAVACLWHERIRAWPAGVAGVALLVGATISFSALAIMATLVAALALLAWRQPAGRAGTLRALIFLLLGFGVPLLVVAFCGVPVVSAARTALSEHAMIAGSASHRSYGTWVWLDLVEFAVFLGLSTTLLAGSLLPTWIRRLRERKGQLPDALSVACMGCLVAVSVCGVVRGETGRIFAPLVPVLMTGVAPCCCPGVRPSRRVVLLTLTLVLVQNGLMALTMMPVSTPF